MKVDPKKKEVDSNSSQVEVTVSQNSVNGPVVGCSCRKGQVESTKIGEVGDLINQIVNANKGVKTIVKVEVVFEDQ